MNFHSSSVLKITLETAKQFPSTVNNDTNPPCNTLATVQTYNIDQRVTRHDVYHVIDCNQTTKEENSVIFRRKIVV